MRSAPRAAGWIAAVLVVAAACTPALQPATPAPAPMPPKDSIELAIFLIGDAGSEAYDGEPVLKELALQSDSLRPVRQFVVFLGDNVYPRGVPPLDHPGRDDAEKRIAAQVLAIRKGSAQGILIPGNHDWDRQGRDGWNSIRRQDTLVREFGGEDVRLAPADGCPGPDVIDLGSRVRIIDMDSEWWVHNDVKPYGETSPCPTRTYQEVADSLGGALRDKGGRHAIVLTHHPLQSGGIHGGHFTLMDHLFPLRNFKRWMWLPLPVIGSLYPFARQMGISNQDISGRKYAEMRAAFEQAFRRNPPLVVASGHDHDLQVIRGGRPRITNAEFQLVSGAGILGHASVVRDIEGSLFKREAAGFMRLDVTTDGRVRLSVTTVVPEGQREEGESAEVYSLWLTDQGGL
ncbi:MAG TPA: metallophosphoesterase [Gemmatimonadales bacterium]|nr:metallophosphoesterase [Gemmatimonadales bacterium]